MEPEGVKDYEIRVADYLDLRWAYQFDGLRMEHRTDENGKPITVLCGALPDTTALYAVVNRLRDLGVKLISVRSP